MINRTIARLNQAEEKLNAKKSKVPEVCCVFEDGSSAIIDMVGAILLCLRSDDAPPGKKIIHVEPTDDSAGNYKLYDTLKQFAGERKYIGEPGSVEYIERDGRTDPPFD